jgi:hypothetical protein
VATVATRREKNYDPQKPSKTHLTPTGLLMEGVYTQNPRRPRTDPVWPPQPRGDHARLMPICVGVMCESCERVYLLAHPNTAQRIQVTGQPVPLPPYELKCVCKAVRGFDRTKMVPYRVSDVTYSRGYGERDHYDAMSSHTLK